MWRDSITVLQPQGSVWQVPARGRRLFLVTSVSKGAEGPLVLEQDLLELLELCVFFGVHSLQVLHVLDHHFHSLAHPALLRHQGKQQLSATASCLEISPSSICSPLVPPWYERFSLLSFLSKLHYTPCPSTCPGFHFSRDCSCKINKSVFSFPSLTTQHHLIYGLRCHHAFAGTAKSYFHAPLGYYTQLHLTFEQGFVIFHRFS